MPPPGPPSAARPLSAALLAGSANPPGRLCTGLLLTARKLSNLATNDLVAVVAGVGGEVSVQIEGTATITRGEEPERYGAEYERQLPGSRALHHDFAVVVVRPSWVRLYDTSIAPASVTEAEWSDPTDLRPDGTMGT